MKFYLLLILSTTIYSLKVYPDECELTIMPDGWEQCRGKETDTPEEVCCFVRGKRAVTYQNRTRWCADIIRADIDTPEKFEITKQKIINGTYWPDVEATLSLEEIICFDPPNFSSKLNLVTSFLLFLLFLLF